MAEINGYNESYNRHNNEGVVHPNGNHVSVSQSTNEVGSDQIDQENVNPGRVSSASSTKMKQFEEDFVKKLIREANAIGAITIDLSNKGLTSIPPELLECQTLEV